MDRGRRPDDCESGAGVGAGTCHPASTSGQLRRAPDCIGREGRRGADHRWGARRGHVAGRERRSADSFRRSRSKGLPGSENTEVRLLYDDEAIYVGVTLHDRDPSLIVTTDTRRDAELDEMDSFQMIFDTFHDRQNGFVFGTNVAGVQYDAQVRDQGEQEDSWDGSWEVRTSTAPNAWIAEFRIPLRTLRYGPAPQTWGVNFYRNIQRTRERTYWAPLARVYDLGRLTSAGELRDLELETPRNFKLLPYVVGSADRNFFPGINTDADLDGDFGFDAEIRCHAEPQPRRHLQHRLRPGRGRRRSRSTSRDSTCAFPRSGRSSWRTPASSPSERTRSWICSSVAVSASTTMAGSCRSSRARRLTGKVNGVNVGVLNMQTDDVAAGTRQQLLGDACEPRAAESLGCRRDVRQPVSDRRTLETRTSWNRTWGRTAATVVVSTSRWPASRRGPRRRA